MVMKKIYLIRHGESDHNVGYDQFGPKAYDMEIFSDSRLTPKGIEQAEKIGKKITELIDMTKVTRIISSSVTRTLQTTDVIFGQIGKSNIPIIVSDSCREFNYSHPCNKRNNASWISENFPHFDCGNISEEDKFYHNGDSYDRLNKFYEELTENEGDHVVISHCTFIIEFMKKKLNKTVDHVDNCEIIECVID
jgi:broad specificity phosphatase PhoE